jgi:AcrR family transcriptional regulator
MQAETPRARLIRAMTDAIVEHGYAATTIADVVRHAGTSKRTFYEHFPDKETCFLAAYEEASAQVLAVIAAAVDPDATFEEQVRAAVRAYLAALEDRPALTRTFLLEIHAAGEAAMRARRDVLSAFAEQLRALVDAGRARDPRLRSLSPQMATAVVGGINELVLVALEKGGGARLGALAGTATELLVSVLAPR